jgi:F-type H+-transporting ATPase subunit O
MLHRLMSVRPFGATATRMLSRQFATAQQMPLIKAMKPNLTGDQGKIIRALFDQAQETKTLDAVKTDLGRLETFLKGNRTLQTYLESPVLGQEDKDDLISTMTKEEKFSPLLGDFTRILVHHGMVDKLFEINFFFNELSNYELKIVEGSVTSAQPLSKDQLKKATAQMKKLIEPSHKLQVKEHVDPSILGGLVVQIGDQQQDLSTATYINHIEDVMGQHAGQQ